MTDDYYDSYNKFDWRIPSMLFALSTFANNGGVKFAQKNKCFYAEFRVNRIFSTIFLPTWNQRG